MPGYDESVQISHEEEGSYHRRELDYRPRSPTTNTTRYVEHRERVPSSKAKSKALVKPTRANYTSDEDSADNFEEWTTSKRKVNHKTRQVETRVSRKLLVRGGEVIADSGPQVTTRIKEDNKVEECEKEKAPKNKGRFEALENAPEAAEASGRVLGEKKEIQRTSREVREENMQYHDERFEELTGKDVHRRAIKAPHELITINDQSHSASSKPRGKMIHYSNKGKKYQDTDEILEVAKLAIDGSVTKEVKRTKHHEEFSEDELPDEKGEAEELRRKPVVERSSRRHADYVNDFDQVDDEPSTGALNRYDSDEEGRAGVGRSRAHATHSAAGSRSRGRGHKEEDPAFPRYEIDPLLNSLREEDFKPRNSAPSYNQPTSRSSSRQVPVNRQRDHSASSSSSASSVGERHGHSGGGGAGASRVASRSRQRSPSTKVEVPEEYRVNRQRLQEGRSGAGSSLSQRSSRRREDAATQARLTDEEVERQSHRSHSPSLNSHEKAARHLQRQSTPNSSRRYYYGDSRPGGKSGKTKLADSLSSSSSSSSLTSLDKTARKHGGAQSRDSGFKSPHSARTETPMSQGDRQIYSVSSKGHKHARPGAVSPTDSLGQRSVKTTTTTMSAGLADRPLSRADKENRRSARQQGEQQTRSKSRNSDKPLDGERVARGQRSHLASEDEGELDGERAKEPANMIASYSTTKRRQADDTISLSSLQGPNATKIKVPYQRVIEIERERAANSGRRDSDQERAARRRLEAPGSGEKQKSSSEMSFQEDIESLSKRLASISQLDSERKTKPLQHYDYKTIVANVQPAGAPNQVVDAYTVRIQQQNSPFRPQEQAAELDQANDSTTTTIVNSNGKQQEQALAETNNNLTLDEFVKYRATPALVVDQSLQSSSEHEQMEDEDDERMSQHSTCSLQSARTYNIRELDSELEGNSSVRKKSWPMEESSGAKENEATEVCEFDENGNGKPAAWIFDPRDNSSTAIVPPARPKGPETPKIDSKTEELNQARGGRSYYLELVEPESSKGAGTKRQRPSSIDSLYARWNSQGALNQPASTYRPLSSTRQNLRQQAHKSATVQTRQAAGSTTAKLAPRRQLPFSGPPSSLGDRSKSSSCLLSVTRPSKYSIYGGFRKPNEANKPVPRLSYSRAIGPRSSRVDSTPTAPSRYLKMR